MPRGGQHTNIVPGTLSLFFGQSSVVADVINMAAVRIAAVQMTCVPGDRAANLAQAEVLVRQCAAQDAQLVLLPELFSAGYLLCSRGWHAAESLDHVRQFNAI